MHESALDQPETLPPLEVMISSEVAESSSEITEQRGTIQSADGTSLFYRYWPAAKWNGRTVIVLHGIGYHSAPYQVIADALNPGGTDVYALDARGHGMSEGPRGFVGTRAQVIADVDAIVEFVREERPTGKVFLLGDSMGADFAVTYAGVHGEKLAGKVLMALALNLHLSQFMSLETARLFPNFFFAHRKPVIDLVGERLESSSRDDDFVARRRSDPLAYKHISFGYLLDIKKLVWDWRWAIAPKVKTPTLIVKGGADTVVSHGECVGYHDRLAADDKRLEILPDVPHTTLWDPQSEEIMRLVCDWVRQH